MVTILHWPESRCIFQRQNYSFILYVRLNAGCKIECQIRVTATLLSTMSQSWSEERGIRLWPWKMQQGSGWLRKVKSRSLFIMVSRRFTWHLFPQLLKHLVFVLNGSLDSRKRKMLALVVVLQRRRLKQRCGPLKPLKLQGRMVSTQVSFKDSGLQ